MRLASDYEPEQLGRQVHLAREQAFVGRGAELAAFHAALHGSHSVLYLHGPGGIGKSALLRRFVQDAAAANRPVVHIDGRGLVASPEAFEAEAAPVLRDPRAVLLVDAFEQLQELEEWLREEFLSRVRMGALVVLAGRHAPDVRWHADPGWARALRVMPLRDLPPAEARALLDSCGVPEESRERVLTFAGGHPLALLLTAASGGAEPEHELVTALLDQLVGEVPSAAHRQALEVSAHAYVTTEDLLRVVLPHDAEELFRWLRRLPFMESGASGLYPHALVREILEADFRWRDRQGHAAMHERVRAHLAGKVRTAADPDVPGAVAALLHLHRGDQPASVRDAHSTAEFREEPLNPADVEALVEMAAEMEGEEAAGCAAFWAGRRPEAFRVYRRAATGEPVAWFAWLRLPGPDQEELAADPVVAAAWAHARATAPLRAGEHLAVARMWLPRGRPGGRALTAMMRWRAVGECLRSEQMAWSYWALPEHEAHEHLWRCGIGRIDVRPRVGDAAYDLFAHDWRAVPPQAWLERFGRTTAPEAGGGAGRLAVLSRAEFGEAVRQALRHFSRPGALAASPLTRTRLVTERAGRAGRDPATALHDLLREAIDALRDDPRSVKLHRALAVTYVSGPPTQQLAATRLGLPFTTYRRHLTAGVERIGSDLWHAELYGVAGPRHRL
ncbi:ATP-binding protein [Nonomuraea ceibae]|uniref:ATP-binding protein n=1 Tax=Nonomuraea ceibae TaxID=1935170 RepID=UPI001C5D9F74|nr:ATP-binding protein [Nonomuraea ceibae]